jgi:phosphatidylglycerol:prolipoprotein diacylglycerol transferase
LPFLAIPFPAIDPVLVQLGPFAIRWYALAYITGIVGGWTLARRLVQRPGWVIDGVAVDDLVLYVTLGIILGGRLGYVLFYQPEWYLTHPVEILHVWRGGMSFHGALIGIITSLFLFAWKRGIPVLEIGDIVAAVGPLGLFLGRIANFINGELWGRTSDVPWAVIFPGAGPLPRHPSQLYEAVLEGLVLFVVLAWLAHKPELRARHGFIGGVFLLGYGIARTISEIFREPEALIGMLPFGTTWGQWLSLPMVIAGLVLMVRAKRA